MQTINKPGPENCYLGEHAELLISSYHRLIGKDLIKPELSSEDRYRTLFQAPYGVVSHNTADNPTFNYGNQTALNLFEMGWSEFTHLPSRKSAQAEVRSERDRLLERVTRQGYINDYQGVRISSTGKRFMIKDATVWNVIDEKGVYCGQAAVFYNWSEL